MNHPAHLGDERFDATRANGAALSDSEAVAFALESSAGRAAYPAAGGRPASELTAN